MHTKLIPLLIGLLIAGVSMDVNQVLILTGTDPSARRSESYVELEDGTELVLQEGETVTVFDSTSGTMTQRSETGWTRTPVKSGTEVRLKPGQLAYLPLASSRTSSARKRIVLNYPPVSSVWHLPAGLSQLTALLREKGHEVLQRYGHIIGLEHVLREQDPGGTDQVLQTIRNSQSDITALYNVRMTLERISRSVPTADRFVVERNNVTYVPDGFEGTFAGLFRTVRNRDHSMWYHYFVDVELPLVQDFKPEIYGISVNDERQLVAGCVLASLVKEASPATLVVLGGNFFTRMGHAFPLPEFVQFFEFCDAVVYSEGYQPLCELAETGDPRHTPGIVWNDGGTVVVNPKPTTPTSFETLPTPHFDGGAMQLSPDVVHSLYTMSNCPMACGFCAISAGSDTYLKTPRFMSVKRVAGHMQALGNRFDIFDETFPVNRQFALGEELKRIGHAATWQCYLTVTEDLLDPDRCQRLYESGCRAVQLGLETLSRATLLREFKSWNHPDSYARILNNLRNAGIQTHAFIIVGIPGEQVSDSLRWLPFLDDHGDALLTIKSGRYRLTRGSPEERKGTHHSRIEVLPDTTPLHLNRNFAYRDPARSLRKDVEAARDLLDEACRRHWAYAVTSTIPWWTNRGRYSWQQLEAMATQLPQEAPSQHLERAVARFGSVVKVELGKDIKFPSFDDVSTFSRSL